MLLPLLRALLVVSAALAQPMSNLTATPLFERCSAPGTSCAATLCCNRPGWSCMTSRKNSATKICRKHAPGVPMCTGNADWACPAGDMCAKPFGDCRTSLCCQPLDFFRGKKDVRFECMRRPKVYYAQCRPPNLDGASCAESSDWMCPGWERCRGAYEECTHSRCCADAGFSCYLNASALVRRHARERSIGTLFNGRPAAVWIASSGAARALTGAKSILARLAGRGRGLARLLPSDDDRHGVV